MAITVLYEELTPPTYKFTRKDGSCTRKFHIFDWSLIANWISQSFPVLGRGLPGAPDNIPGFPWLIAETITIEPFGDPELCDAAVPPNAPRGGLVTVEYQSHHFDTQAGQDHSDQPGDIGNNSQVYLEWSIELSGSYVTYPGLALQWLSDKTAVGEDINAGFIEPQIEHTLTFHQCPQPPWGAIRRCSGRVNAKTFCGAPPECLLFLGLSGKREFAVQGTRVWSLVYKFSERNVATTAQRQAGTNYGWNYFLRPNVNPVTWDKIILAVNPPPILPAVPQSPYQVEDFSNLFVPGGA